MQINQSILVTDDTNLPINYQTSKIDSNFSGLIVDIDELYEIFKNNRQNIFKYNTIDCFTIILKSGNELSLNTCQNIKSTDILFLKISNKLLKDTDNEILISMTDFFSIDFSTDLWQTSPATIQDNIPKYRGTGIMYNADKQTANNDINGFSNCQNILDIIDGKSHIYGECPIISRYAKIKIAADDKSIYQGYLPAMGQMKFMIDYIDLINFVTYKYTNKILPIAQGAWWSSTEDAHNAFAWQYLCGQPGRVPKQGHSNGMPLFKKIK